MRRNRGHWTTKPDHIRNAIGGTEKRMPHGGWIKITEHGVFRGTSRSEVRNKAKSAEKAKELANAA